MNVYEKCPMIENEYFKIRKIEMSDAKDLLKVYSDKNALPFFNGDNCHQGNFYFSTEDHMKRCMESWLREYDSGGFVRFAIIDKRTKEVIGTIELFNRKAEDYFNQCGLLRLDVRSDYEEEKQLSSILELITSQAYEWFECKMIATKARVYAVERMKALEAQGYQKSNEKIVGHDGTLYGDYWVREAY